MRPLFYIVCMVLLACHNNQYTYLSYSYNANDPHRILKESETVLHAESDREAIVKGRYLYKRMKMLADTADKNFRYQSFKILDPTGRLIYDSKKKGQHRD